MVIKEFLRKEKGVKENAVLVIPEEDYYAILIPYDGETYFFKVTENEIGILQEKSGPDTEITIKEVVIPVFNASKIKLGGGITYEDAFERKGKCDSYELRIEF